MIIREENKNKENIKEEEKKIVILQVTGPDEERQLDRFFMENELEYSDEHPVETDRINMWKALYDGGMTVGGLALALRQGEYIIDGIAVDKAARGKGLGERLLKKAVGRSREMGAEKIYLVARSPEFFRHFGFFTVPRDKAPEFFECLGCPQYGVTCHPEVMCLELKK